MCASVFLADVAFQVFKFYLAVVLNCFCAHISFLFFVIFFFLVVRTDPNKGDWFDVEENHAANNNVLDQSK